MTRREHHSAGFHFFDTSKKINYYINFAKLHRAVERQSGDVMPDPEEDERRDGTTVVVDTTDGRIRDDEDAND